MGRRLACVVVLLASTARAQESTPTPVAPPPALTTPTPVAPPPAPATPAPPASPPAQAYPYAYPPYPYPYPYGYMPPPPAQLPYQAGDRIPPGYHTESRVRRGPIIVGATMGGTTYLINLLVAGIAGRGNDDGGRITMLYIPGIGTWGYVGQACDSDGNDGCSFLVLHSAAHTVGVALFLYGFAAPRTVLVRNDVSWAVVPQIAKSNGGLSLIGQF